MALMMLRKCAVLLALLLVSSRVDWCEAEVWFTPSPMLQHDIYDHNKMGPLSFPESTEIHSDMIEEINSFFPEVEEDDSSLEEELPSHKNHTEEKDSLEVRPSQEVSPIISASTEEAPIISARTEESPTIPTSPEESPIIPASSEEALIIPASPEEAPIISASTEESPIISANTEESPIISTSPEESPIILSSTEESLIISTSPEQSPIISASAEESPIISANTEESPIISASTEESPIISANTEESPVILASPEKAPIISVNTEESPIKSADTEESPIILSSTEESLIISASPEKSPIISASTEESPNVGDTPKELRMLWVILKKSPDVRISPEESPNVRAGLEKTPYIRAGLEKSPYVRAFLEEPYVRAGLEKTPYIRAGLEKLPYVRAFLEDLPYFRAGLKKSPYVRDGLEKSPYARFFLGKLTSVIAGLIKSPYFRASFEKSPYVRAGPEESPYVRAGLEESTYVKADLEKSPYVRAGLEKSPYVRVGLNKLPYVTAGLEKSSNVGAELKESRILFATTEKLPDERPSEQVVRAPPCSIVFPFVQVPADVQVVFTSPNYPAPFRPFSQCGWTFAGVEGARLLVACNPVTLDARAFLLFKDLVDGGRIKRFTNQQRAEVQTQFVGNRAQVGLLSRGSRVSGGFSCRMSSTAPPTTVPTSPQPPTTQPPTTQPPTTQPPTTQPSTTQPPTTQQPTTRTTTSQPPTTDPPKPKPPSLTTISLVAAVVAADRGPTIASTPVCRCGQSAFTRIVGGAEAGEHVHPWVVAMTYPLGSGELTVFCGGSLISSQFVLTAAHCVAAIKRLQGRDIRLLLGLHTLDHIRGPGILDLRPLEYIVHPAFNNKTLDSDLALIRITPLDLSRLPDTILPVCLPLSKDALYDMAKAVVAGWGSLSSGGDSPKELMEVSIPILPQQKCRELFGQSVTGNMLCAGFLAGGKDSCQGDSGGPLVVTDEASGSVELVGVVSWGIGCARANKPGVYVRVANFLPWLVESTRGSLTCQRV